MIHADCESFCVLDVTKVGMFRYWEDPSAEVLCLSWCIDDGPVHIWVQGDEPPRELCNAIRMGMKIGAHNAGFEFLAFKHWLSKHGFPMPKLKQMECTAAQAAALALPRALGKVAMAVGLALQKDDRGKKLIKLFCAPRKPTKKDPGLRIYPWEDPENFEALCEYCKQDTRVEREIWNILPRLSEDEQNVWRLDFKINNRGIPLDVDFIDNMIDMSDEHAAFLKERCIQLTNGINPTQRDKILEWIQEQGGEVDNLQSKTLKDVVQDDELLPDNVKELIDIRLAASRVSVKKLLAAKKCMSSDNRIRGTILYHGATTGRFSGKLLQPHNFVRPLVESAQQAIIVDLINQQDIESIQMLYGEPMTAMSFALRGMICAPEGRMLRVADYAQIEARGLVKAAGQLDAVERYRRGVDQYRIMASIIFGKPIEKITSEERKVGKDVILGCGYQMGAEKFQATCKSRGLNISFELAERSVKAFRKQYDKVKKYWYDIERAAVSAVEKPGARFRVGYVSYIVEDDFLYCDLPSGRRLAYPYPELKVVQKYEDFKLQVSFMGEVGSGVNNWKRNTTYGGKLVENIIQAISRDLMVNGMFNAESKGYEIIMTVHDELLSENDIGFGSLKEYEAALCDMPDWFHDCPIVTEGYEAPRWRK